MITIRRRTKSPPWVYDDGGRTAAGYSGSGYAGDCVTRAIAIGTGLPYNEVCNIIKETALRERPGDRVARSSPHTGVYPSTIRHTLAALDWDWHPTMFIGSGCRMHVRHGELPSVDRVILRLSKHIVAVINGVIHDTGDPSRGGTRCVYGYWVPAEATQP